MNNGGVLYGKQKSEKNWSWLTYQLGNRSNANDSSIRELGVISFPDGQCEGILQTCTQIANSKVVGCLYRKR
jgi:hypothetical protein